MTSNWSIYRESPAIGAQILVRFDERNDADRFELVVGTRKFDNRLEANARLQQEVHIYEGRGLGRRQEGAVTIGESRGLAINEVRSIDAR